MEEFIEEMAQEFEFMTHGDLEAVCMAYAIKRGYEGKEMITVSDELINKIYDRYRLNFSQKGA